ncbi:MAG: hypothetical protein KF727_07435 [Microbacteriaceae bacterium]|nr:hypothetical protein [Microbacteriaceae bacterium]
MATVEFGAGLTLVRGPSDTGKSFIVNAIDFMLGASALKEIPERAGYSTVLLGVELPSGETVTLARSVAGGTFSLYRSDIREGPLPVSDEDLSPKHNPNSETNISRFLLKQIDLDNSRIRKNAQGATDTLSFRNLAHLCIVDETQMQSEVPPALSGQFITKTKEVSTLKLLLEGEDDSALVAPTGSQERTKANGAKVEVIDRLIEDTQTRLAETADEADLRDQLARLNRTIEERATAVDGLLADRAGLAEQVRVQQEVIQRTRTEVAEVAALLGRFDLLDKQYESDLQRLATIREAGAILGFFTPGKCPFCGAELEDQHYNREHGQHGTAFDESVAAEIAKTTALRADLGLTLAELRTRHGDALGAGRDAASRAEELRSDLREFDERLEPEHGEVRELIAIRSQLEQSLSLYARVAELVHLKASIIDDSDADTAIVSDGLNLTALREFSTELATRLGAWGYPDASSVRYDRAVQDIQAGDQFRSAHGKGVRAILHAGFTIGLAQYCFDRDAPHPGFVVLDSPLVTYRPPDEDASPIVDESLPAGIVADFYRDLQTRFDGQVIVMENLDPTVPLDSESVDIHFTKQPGMGRYGFLPQRTQAKLTAAEG